MESRSATVSPVMWYWARMGAKLQRHRSATNNIFFMVLFFYAVFNKIIVYDLPDQELVVMLLTTLVLTGLFLLS
jgi:hypothetical protein